MKRTTQKGLEFGVLVFIISGLIVVSLFLVGSGNITRMVSGFEETAREEIGYIDHFKYPVLRNQLKEPGSLGNEIGTPIGSCYELYDRIEDTPYADFHLTSNIDCWDRNEKITSSFSGKLDGRGYTIENTNTPLFGTNNGQIKNIRLEGVNIERSGSSGAVAVQNSGRIENTTVSGEIGGQSDIGGIVGTNTNKIISSFSEAHVNGTGSNVGGLAGSNTGTIKNSYAVGSVIGGDTVGGLVGQTTGTVDKTYSGARVQSDGSRGGLTGSGEADNSFWSIDASGIDPEEDQGGGRFKTDPLMESKTTYTDERVRGLDDPWDFENIWMF